MKHEDEVETEIGMEVEMGFDGRGWMKVALYIFMIAAAGNAMLDLHRANVSGKTLSTMQHGLDLSLITLLLITVILDVVILHGNRNKERLVLVMTEEVATRLSELQQRIDAGDKVVVVRKALAYLDMVADWEDEGGRVVFRKPGAEDETIERVKDSKI